MLFFHFFLSNKSGTASVIEKLDVASVTNRIIDRFLSGIIQLQPARSLIKGTTRGWNSNSHTLCWSPLVVLTIHIKILYVSVVYGLTKRFLFNLDTDWLRITPCGTLKVHDKPAYSQNLNEFALVNSSCYFIAGCRGHAWLIRPFINHHFNHDLNQYTTAREI